MVHFVLVHGLCHGAWCWYKVKPLLESAGHRVTAPDLAASGINMAKIEEIHTIVEYTQPLIDLMDSLPPGEKVTLVGHSLGGYNLALAMDKFPHKISTAVFLAAFMPDSTHSPSYVLDVDLALAELMMRPGSSFQDDLSKGKPFSEVGYGSVNRVYIVCKEDLTFPEDLQRWIIENNPTKEVMEIEGADHMPMTSKPNELCQCLLDIATKYN